MGRGRKAQGHSYDQRQPHAVGQCIHLPRYLQFLDPRRTEPGHAMAGQDLVTLIWRQLHPRPAGCSPCACPRVLLRQRPCGDL